MRARALPLFEVNLRIIIALLFFSRTFPGLIRLLGIRPIGFAAGVSGRRLGEIGFRCVLLCTHNISTHADSDRSHGKALIHWSRFADRSDNPATTYVG
jgi:hypothetical protein